MTMSTDEFNRIVDTIFALIRSSITVTDLEKEIACREKWGKRQRYELEEYTTEQLKVLIENWHNAESAR